MVLSSLCNTTYEDEYNEKHTCVNKSVSFALFAFGSVIFATVCIAVSPIFAVYKGAIFIENSISNKIKQKRHKKSMKNDWQYRLNYTAPKINTLKNWEKYANKTQWDRAISQINEANDIPYEVWKDLLDVDNQKWEPYAKLVGLSEYACIKDSVVKDALEYYSSQLEAFTNSKSKKRV